MNIGDQCLEGHKNHDTLAIDLFLSGEHYGIQDVPPIPKRLETKIKLEVFEWKQYRNSPRYCPADDEFSRSIFRNGVWEGFETSLFLDILDQGNRDNVVLDFGSQLGWYSILAGLKGYDVVAYDFCKEIIDLFIKNISLNKLNTKIGLVSGFIDESCSEVYSPGGINVEFLKSDVEGNEQYVYKMTKHLFEQKRINYAMFEISPCFNDSYPKLCHDIISNGYAIYMIPQKGTPHFKEYSEQPLRTIKKYSLISSGDIDKVIKCIRQENFLFINSNLL